MSLLRRQGLYIHTYTLYLIYVSTALLWTSPENINFPHPRKSKEGDIYALGIIIAEIINRTRPFASYTQYTSRGKLVNKIFV